MPSLRPGHVLALAGALCALAGLGAAWLHPAGSDLLLHSLLIRASAEAPGWAAAQDPWYPGMAGGWALAHAYPTLPHRAVAAVARLGLDPGLAFALARFLAVAALPWAVWLGSRWLGQTAWQAALAALVVATLRCADGFGHAPLSYSITGGYGLFGQSAGILLASLALPAWIAASTADGLGLRAPRWLRVVLAALLLSWVVRSSFVATVVVGFASLAAVSVLGPPGGAPRRLLRWAVIAAAALALSAGFLVDFLGELSITAQETLVDRSKVASIGAARVLLGLARGSWLDGGAPGVWSVLCAVAVAASLRRSSPRLRALSAAFVLVLLLFCGRATWGGWVDSLPLLGRFHDQRYLVGLGLVAPWLVAELWPLLTTAVERRRPGLGRWLLVAPALAVLVQLGALRRDLAGVVANAEAVRSMDRSLDAVRQGLGPLDVVGRLGPLPSAAGTDPLALLALGGQPVLADPRGHYGPLGELMPWWEAALDGRLPPGSAGVRPADLRGALVAQVLHRDPGAWRLEPTGFPSVAAVRSDLVLRRLDHRLQGASIGWVQAGLASIGQHPAVLFEGDRVPRPFLRAASLDRPDPGVFAGLPRLAPTARLEVERRGAGLQVEVVGAGSEEWLIAARSWHPDWAVEVDGEPVAPVFLLPGWLGVPLPEGDSQVRIAWPAAPWRGAWAAGQIALSFGLLALFARRRPRGPILRSLEAP